MEVPSDQILDMLQKIMDGKAETLNAQLKGLNNEVSELRKTIETNHVEVKGLITKHVGVCSSNMDKHDDRIRELFEHKNKVSGALAIIGVLVTLIIGFLIAHFA